MKVTGESNTEKSPRAVQQLTSHFLHRESHFNGPRANKSNNSDLEWREA